MSRPGPRPPWLRSRPSLGPESLVARLVADLFLGFPQPPDKRHSVTAGRPDYRADSSQLSGVAVHMEMLDQAPLLPAFYQDNCDAVAQAFPAWLYLVCLAEHPPEPHGSPVCRLSATRSFPPSGWSQARGWPSWRRRHGGDRPQDKHRWLKHRGTSCTHRLLETRLERLYILDQWSKARRRKEPP